MPIKLLDYGNHNPFGEMIGQPRYLAWPVNVYRVTLPSESDDVDGVNAFERVILKLIEAGGYGEAKMLAEETCMPESLAQCVLWRLQDRGFIDRYNQIVKQQRGKWAIDEDHQRVYVTALLFREMASGKILPFLHVLSSGNPLRTKDEEEERIYSYRNRYLRIKENRAHSTKVPTPADVVSALRSMHRRSRKSGNEPPLPAVRQITIAPDPELYHLKCPVAIQKSDAEYRIADPFGSGFSLALENSFESLLESNRELADWFLDWKSSLQKERTERQSKRQLGPKEPFDSDYNQQLFPNLLAQLRCEYGSKGHRYPRSIIKIYAAIEWALFYACSRRPYHSAVQLLKLTEQSEHGNLLRESAEALSLELPQGGLHPITPKKLDDFLQGKAVLGTVLGIALLMATEDADHPLRRIAVLHQNFIMELLKIKKQRDDVRHGAGKLHSRGSELPEDAFMREVVSTLLPTIQFEESVAPPGSVTIDADDLLDARTSIQNEFTFSFYNRLGIHVQDRLIAAERFWLSCVDGDDALMFANDLYAVLQASFRRSLTGIVPPDVEESDYISVAKETARDCGLGDLPRCLLTPKRSSIRETLLGHDVSLGACAVVFLLISDPENTLRAIAAVNPSFIADVALITELSGHGNLPLPLPKEDIRMIRKAAYSTIKTLLEV